jgi:nucleoside-diphosphate-sugar epimerase
MRCLVTGVAGFVGSSLADRLLELGHSVIGYDRFIPYYDLRIKKSNLTQAQAHPAFRFVEADIADVFSADSMPPEGAPHPALAGVDVVFHQAAQAGVRASWGKDFEIYTHNNILATQRLLEAARTVPGIKVVYASSSSVYGETPKFPMNEDDPTAPVSPYGVSKLAAEHLCRLYTHNFGVHTVSLRYFTVFGPRQRPDMAFHKLCRAAVNGDPFTLFGDGNQSRDFTFISDIVEGNIASALRGKPGAVYNLGGGARTTMLEVIDIIKDLAGGAPNITVSTRALGDVTHTGADTTRAQQDLGFQPQVNIRDGLARELDFIRNVVLPLGTEQMI